MVMAKVKEMEELPITYDGLERRQMTSNEYAEWQKLNEDVQKRNDNFEEIPSDLPPKSNP
jgi:hypothetical protein